jgi:arylsulfatase A-like enzyme
MLIGKYGSETHRNWGHFNTFSDADTFVAERMQRAGIHTLSVQAHHYFGVFGGLDRGFDVLDLSAAPPKEAKWAHDARITSELITDAAIKQLQAVPKAKRFFAWVHYLDPHADYKRHAGAPDFGNKARGLYDGEVWFTDQQIGRLLDFVADSGLSDTTSIILTSDHGEAFGEHNMWRHGFELWEVLVRVPLIVHLPKAAPRRVAPRRSLIDMVPTMLDLMRLPAVPHSSQAQDDDFVSGVSLLPDVVAGANALATSKDSATRDVLIDMPAGPYNGSRRAFIHGDLKLVISRGAHKELYDLKVDPGERKNIWRSDRKRIQAAYAAFKGKLKEIVVKGKRK